jgi:non-homologous end joining protein Ku
MIDDVTREPVESEERGRGYEYAKNSFLPADVKVAPDVLKLADHIVESKKGDFDPSQRVDRYEDAVVE